MSNKDTAPGTPCNTTNTTSEISKTAETRESVETACTKQVVVKLYRLPEKTVNRILSTNVSSSLESGQKSCYKEILKKCLLPKVESYLTEWVKKRARKNGGRIQEDKIIKKAKQIFQRLKAQGGEKYKNIKFTVTRKWYYRYRMRAGWFDKQPLVNPSKHQNHCRCNIGNNLRIKSSVSTPEGSDDENDWCLRVKNDLIHEKARDLRIDSLASCPFLTYGSERDQKRLSEIAQEELDKQQEALRRRCATPMPDSGPDSESDSPVSDNESSDKEESSDTCEVVFQSETTPTSVDTTNKCVDVQPVLITLDDDEISAPSTILVAAFARKECSSSEIKLEAIGNKTSQVPFFKSVGNENESVKTFRQKLEKIIKQEKYIPQQIFCVHETTLYWKYMSVNCGILETINGELPESKDPVMLLLCTNASGDCRFEPMLVYSKEDPPPIRHLIKSTLPVTWKFHPRAKITNSLFEDWITYSFVPTVQVFCMEHRIPFQVLLLLDSAPCHNPVLEFANPNVKVIFLSPDIAPFVQPMEQGIIATFKINYLRRMFEMIGEAVELGNGETAQSFWNSFNILCALKLIKAAWLDVPLTVVTMAWKIMCLGTIPEGSENENPFSSVIMPTICAAKHLQVNISERDITNWLHYQSHELTVDELKVLEQWNSIEASSSSTEMPPATMTPSKLLEAFKCLRTAMEIFESEDPNFKRSSYVIEEIRRSYQCYREVYSELKKTNALENDTSDDACDSMKVVDDAEPSSTTDVKSSPSSLVKWLSSSSVNSSQGLKVPLTFIGSCQQSS